MRNTPWMLQFMKEVADIGKLQEDIGNGEGEMKMVCI